MKQIQLIFTIFLFLSSFTANSGMIYVAGDVDAFFGGDTSRALSEILAGGPNVGVVNGNTGSLRNFLISAEGAEVATDFSTDAINGFGLLAIGGRTSFNDPLGLSVDDIENVRNFLIDGGNVLLQVESLLAAPFNSYNEFLAGIGSSIRFTGSRALVRNVFDGFFICNGCNTLTGGTETRAQFQTGEFQGQLAFASENITAAASVPAPPTLLLFGFAIMGLGAIRKKRMR